jgi:hypothetical protein
MFTTLPEDGGREISDHSFPSEFQTLQNSDIKTNFLQSF